MSIPNDAVAAAAAAVDAGAGQKALKQLNKITPKASPKFEPAPAEDDGVGLQQDAEQAVDYPSEGLPAAALQASETPVTQASAKPLAEPPDAAVAEDLSHILDAVPAEGDKATKVKAGKEKPAPMDGLPAEVGAETNLPAINVLGGKFAGIVVSKKDIDSANFAIQSNGAMPVEFNSFEAFKVTNGNVVIKRSNVVLGSSISFNLVSCQKNFQISPGDDKDPVAKAAVRYSDDGITTTQGEDCAAYLAKLQEVYEDASMKERVVLVGILLKADKPTDMLGEVFQVDLPPTSKTLFDRCGRSTAVKISRGLMKVPDQVNLTLTCNPVHKDDNDWTEADFKLADPSIRLIALAD